MSGNSNNVLRLSSTEQNKLILEFLFEQDQKFVDFINSKMNSKFQEGDLISNKERLYRVSLLCPDGLPYCEHLMSYYKEINEEQYEKGELSLKARFLDYQESNNSNDDFDYEEYYSPCKMNVESFEKVESVLFIKGYRRFKTTGKLKKTPEFFVVADPERCHFLENRVLKIAKVKIV